MSTQPPPQSSSQHESDSEEEENKNFIDDRSGDDDANDPSSGEDYDDESDAFSQQSNSDFDEAMLSANESDQEEEFQPIGKRDIQLGMKQVFLHLAQASLGIIGLLGIYLVLVPLLVRDNGKAYNSLLREQKTFQLRLAPNGSSLHQRSDGKEIISALLLADQPSYVSDPSLMEISDRTFFHRVLVFAVQVMDSAQEYTEEESIVSKLVGVQWDWTRFSSNVPNGKSQTRSTERRWISLSQSYIPTLSSALLDKEFDEDGLHKRITAVSAESPLQLPRYAAWNCHLELFGDASVRDNLLQRAKFQAHFYSFTAVNSFIRLTSSMVLTFLATAILLLFWVFTSRRRANAVGGGKAVLIRQLMLIGLVSCIVFAEPVAMLDTLIFSSPVHLVLSLAKVTSLAVAVFCITAIAHTVRAKSVMLRDFGDWLQFLTPILIALLVFWPCAAVGTYYRESGMLSLVQPPPGFLGSLASFSAIMILIAGLIYTVVNFSMVALEQYRRGSDRFAVVFLHGALTSSILLSSLVYLFAQFYWRDTVITQLIFSGSTVWLLCVYALIIQSNDMAPSFSMQPTSKTMLAFGRAQRTSSDVMDGTEAREMFEIAGANKSLSPIALADEETIEDDDVEQGLVATPAATNGVAVPPSAPAQDDEKVSSNV